ncbi:hypothetical protein BU17DRAFT_71262 [Hysterangium stoloniferum]|nr:hypothetical protein BU17DRAFT_71262 [Hysterangium stoloniferum]
MVFPSPEFLEEQHRYFEDILCRRWACDEPDHSVCILCTGGQHIQLTQSQISQWVSLLCRGEGSIAQPPPDLLSPVTSSTAIVAIARPPSQRRRPHSSVMKSTASLRDTLKSATASSGGTGPGYYAGKGLEWLGERCLNGLDRIFITTRCWKYEQIIKNNINTQIPRVTLTLKLGKKRIVVPLSKVKTESELCRILQNTLMMTSCVQTPDLQDRAMAIINEADRGRFIHSPSYQLVSELCDSYTRALQRNLPDYILDELYNGLMKAPLEMHASDAASYFISVLCRQLMYMPLGDEVSDNVRTFLSFMLRFVVARLVETRPLFDEEIDTLMQLAEDVAQRSSLDIYLPGKDHQARAFLCCAKQHIRAREIVVDAYGSTPRELVLVPIIYLQEFI